MPLKSFVIHSFLQLTSQNFEIQVLHEGISINNLYSSEFRNRWPKVRSTLWPLHYKSIGENWNVLLLTENTLKHRNGCEYDTLNREIAPVTPFMPLWSSQVVTTSFFYNNFRWKHAMKTPWLCLAQQYESNDTWPSLLPWPEVKLSYPFQLNL